MPGFIKSTPAASPEEAQAREYRGRECCNCYAGTAAAAFLIAVVITGLKASDDQRGDRIDKYNAVVDAWVSSGEAAYSAKYDGKPFPTVHLTGGAVAGTGPVVLSAQTTGDGIKRSIDDVRDYEQGYMLVGQADMFLDNVQPPEHFEIRFGDQSYPIEAAKCETHRMQTKLYFLREITLVERSGTEMSGIRDVAEYRCALDYHVSDGQSHSSEKAARNSCKRGLESSRTSAVRVVVRSPDDPYVRSPAIIGNCGSNLGNSSSKWTGIAIGCAVGMVVFWCCCCCGIWALRADRARDAEEGSAPEQGPAGSTFGFDDIQGMQTHSGDAGHSEPQPTSTFNDKWNPPQSGHAEQAVSVPVATPIFETGSGSGATKGESAQSSGWADFPEPQGTRTSTFGDGQGTEAQPGLAARSEAQLARTETFSDL